MTEDLLLILLIAVVLISLWSFILRPRVEEARAERARLAAEKRAAEEARRKKLREEREQLLKSIRAKAPNYILQTRLEFEREYRSTGGEGMFGQEMSPLVCFGYRVGKTNGRTEPERRAILEYAIAADYGATLPFLLAAYRNEWGGSLRSYE